MSSITTRNGDDGSTGILYGRRLPKDHPRVEAYGAVDELMTALGLAKAYSDSQELSARIEKVQRALLILSTELAVADEDRPRFEKSKLDKLSQDDLAELDRWIAQLEATSGGAFSGFVLPGRSLLNAALHQARTATRRAERRLVTLQRGGATVRPLVGQYLNRLSDLCWLLAETP